MIYFIKERVFFGQNKSDFIKPQRHNRYFIETPSTPNPYMVLRFKLMEDASSKYLVGQVISPISKPA